MSKCPLTSDQLSHMTREHLQILVTYGRISQARANIILNSKLVPTNWTTPQQWEEFTRYVHA